MKKVVLDTDLDEDRLDEASRVLGRRVKPGKEVWVEEDKIEALKEAIGEEAVLEDMND